MNRLRSFHILFILCSLGLTACSTAKPVGVRSDFSSVKVKKIGLLSVFSTAKFSLDEGEFDEVRSLYHQSLNEELSKLNFQILSRKTVEEPLSDSAKLALSDGLGLPKSLELLFEADDGEFGAEVETVQNFHRAQTLPPHLLFAEIVYHNNTVCQESSTQWNAYAEIENGALPLPSKCVLAHFQAKLIDAQSGQPMWSNHVFLEYRYQKDDVSVKEVIGLVIQKTLSGSNGISNLK